jgi:hypothetical protein
MKAQFCILLLATTMLLGCAPLRFYPVQGPLVSMNPAPVLTAKLNAKNISLVLNDGEVCKGKWATATPGEKATPPNGMPPDNMSSLWDSIYGQGFYKSHILGMQIMQSVAHGQKGTTLEIQLYKSDTHEINGVPDIKGVAKDSKGNVYKVVY